MPDTEFDVVFDVSLDKDFKPLQVFYRHITFKRGSVYVDRVMSLHSSLLDKESSRFVYSEPTVSHYTGVLRYTALLLRVDDKYLYIDKKGFHWASTEPTSSFDVVYIDIKRRFNLKAYLDNLFSPFAISSASESLMLSQVDAPIALEVDGYKDTNLVVPQNVKYLYIDMNADTNLEHIYLPDGLKYIAVITNKPSRFFNSVAQDILGSDVSVDNLIIANDISQGFFVPSMKIKAVHHIGLRKIVIPELVITACLSDIVCCEIPVIQLKSTAHMPACSVKAPLVDTEIRNFSTGASIHVESCYTPKAGKVTITSAFPLYALEFETGFNRIEACVPHCENIYTQRSYNFTAKGIFDYANCSFDYIDCMYAGEKEYYAGTLEVRSYEHEVVFRLPKGMLDTIPVRVPIEDLSL